MGEKILVVDSKNISILKKLPGISTSLTDLAYLKMICSSSAYFADRKEAEKNEEQKQIIPYILIRKGNKVLTYLRSKKSGEDRLHDKWSVGVGGHINPVDDSKKFGINMILSNAINRELTEELDWGNIFDQTINNLTEFGLIYDDKDPVGRVHLGYLMIVDVDIDEEVYPKPKEDTIADCKWFTIEDALKLNLEGWSEIALKEIANIKD